MAKCVGCGYERKEEINTVGDLDMYGFDIYWAEQNGLMCVECVDKIRALILQIEEISRTDIEDIDFSCI